MKLLIVDDEISIREWLTYIIERMDFNFEKILSASDGEAAAAMYDAENPEIIFVDMLMPKMGGMELIEYIRRRDTGAEVVILTSHSEFEFVRKALQYGVRDYVLKPEINREKIGSLLEDICRRLETRQKLMNEDLSFSSMKKTAFVREILCAQPPPDITREILNDYTVAVSDHPLFVIAFKSYKKTEKFDIVLPGDPCVEHVVGFVYNQNINLLLCNIRRQASILEQMYNLNEYTAKIARTNNFDIGVSRIYPGISGIRDAVNEAVYILKMTFYGEKCTYEDFLSYRDNSALIHQILNKYHDQIKNSRAGKMPVFDLFQEMLDALFSLRSGDIMTLKEGVVGILYAMTASKTEADDQNFQRVKRDIMETAQFTQLRRMATEYLLSRTDSHFDGEDGYSRNIAVAVRFICDHVTDELSLTKVARCVHLNPDYFSRLFKKETGQNFVNFVEAVKMERAAGLLRETDMKVYEVASELGYSNVSYFSALFKKQYGVNPFSYKNCL